MPLSRDHILWATALMVEKEYGSQGRTFIEAMIGELVTRDDIKAVDLWLRVADRFEALGVSDSLGPTMTRN